MKKKKVLFVTSRSPYSKIFSGDRQRAKIIIEHLKIKNDLEILFSDKYDEFGKTSLKKIFFKRRSIDKIKGIIYSIFTLKPLQLGYFYSEDIKNYLEINHEKYDTIIFHLIRSAQYLPKDFKGKKILEMTDLLSKNYNQVIKSFSLFNPLFYIYFLEKILVKKYEKECIQNFDKIILISKNDFKNQNNFQLNKFIEIPNPALINKSLYKFKLTNKKILFIGNIKYLPNREACFNFIKKILPRVNKIYPDIQFNIIGEINKTDKFFFNSKKNVICHGMVKKINNHIKNSICGICNLHIATGLQTKILTYISYGLPCISSELSYKNTYFNNKKEIIVYKNENQLVNSIKLLKNNKKLSEKISRNSYLALKKKYSKKVFSNYLKAI